MIKKIKKM